MAGRLRALVHGSGFAGQGHARAFADCGVEVVGMVSRTRDVVTEVARKLSIPYAGTDWDEALDALNPDIVVMGTPGGAHFDPLMAALGKGCHAFCDKPLTVSASTARDVYKASEDAGVKTAFAASFRYQPHALLARELVAQGAIGQPWEVECVSHYNLNPLIPWGWSHRIDLGGGRLSNNFTHKLSIVEHVLDGHITEVNGESRNDMGRAPVVDGVHDFREREKFAPGPADTGKVKWRDVDSEWAYTVIAHVQAARAGNQPVTALFRHGGLLPRFQPDYVAFYGSEGAIHVSGSYAQGPLHMWRRGGEWERVAVPARITESLPRIEDDTQRNWTVLAGLFVKDIEGARSSDYQSFLDGWIYQEVVDAIRRREPWFKVPTA